jgi:histidine triad (HIT) family protein
MVQTQSECIFCRILAGEIPSEILHRDDRCFVIRDIAPIAPVHLLVIPINHYIHATDSSPDMDATLGHLMAVAREMAKQEGIFESGYRMSVNQGPHSGQTVDHLHLHVVGGRPLKREG